MTALVRGLGTTRRLRALVAIGWTEPELADLFCLRPQLIAELLDGVHEQVQGPLARYIALKYERLCGAFRKSPEADASRARARSLGWPSTHAWDDIDIDDPKARARGWVRGDGIDEFAVELAVRGELAPGAKLRKRDAHEAIRRMRERDIPTAEIARRAHVSERTVHRQGNENARPQGASDITTAAA
jgi:hypothetical protein